MNRLHDLQRDFSRFIFQDTGHIPGGIKAGGIRPEQRLAIYRNNTRAGLTEALREVYQVVNRLVGDRFFNRLAAAYIDTHPPQSACLLEFGGRFADMIAGFRDAQALPYLADTARLEWYWHEAYHEADDNALEVSKLAQLDPALHERLAFKIHPSVRFIASDYPIARIWACNQAGDLSNQPIDLHEGACRLLIHRVGMDVEIASLNQAEYLFLSTLAAGLTLTQTVERVMTEQADFDVQASLQHCLLRGLLTDFFII